MLLGRCGMKAEELFKERNRPAHIRWGAAHVAMLCDGEYALSAEFEDQSTLWQNTETGRFVFVRREVADNGWINYHLEVSR